MENAIDKIKNAYYSSEIDYEDCINDVNFSRYYQGLMFAYREAYYWLTGVDLEEYGKH